MLVSYHTPPYRFHYRRCSSSRRKSFDGYGKGTTNAALEYLIALILLANYAKEKYKPALLFGLAMLFYAIAHTVAGTALMWVKQAHNMVYTDFVKDPNYVIWESLRNVFVGLFMLLAVAAMTEYAPKESLVYGCSTTCTIPSSLWPSGFT